MWRYGVLILFLFQFGLACAEEGRNLKTREGDSTGHRLALVIGNDNYQHVQKLKNARADATAMAKALEGAGFRVTLKLDVDRRGMLEAMRSFKAQVHGGDEVVFYFSGHGVQLGEANYLLPVSIQDRDEDQVKDDSFPLKRVLDDLSEKSARFSLLVIDACRDNPFKGSGRAIGGRGLAPVSASGQMVIYSAGAGQEALDNLGREDKSPNGLFTRIFLKEMQTPGERIQVVVTNVRNQVAALAEGVGHKQVPAYYDEAVGNFSFYPGTPVQVVSVEPEPVGGGGVSLEDLKKQEKVKAKWVAWQGRMRADFDRIEKLGVGPELRVTAWKRFLTSYGEKNPFSEEDETLRAQARDRKAQAEGEVARMAEEARQRQAVGQAGQVLRDCGVCPEMVVIPAGSFEMGSSDGASDEGPVHRVDIARPFALGKYEVTQGEWRALMGNNPSDFKDCGDRCPVENVSWEDAQSFVQRLNERTGKRYRLPSEAEWEYACRGGGQDTYCGGEDVDALGWYDKNSGGQAHPVGQKQANGYGLYDMSGNVWEWTEECYHDSYAGAPGDGSAWTEGDCGRRVLRGGSWNYFADDLRAAYRIVYVPGIRLGNVGFRVARTLP